MSVNGLEPVGDAGSIGYVDTGTLTIGASACGTLTAGSLTGVIGDGFNGNVTNATFTAISLIYDITPNTVDVAEVPTTKLNFIADTSQPGTPNHGEVSVTVAFSAATVALVNGWIDNKKVNFFRITIDDATTDSAEVFLGFVKSWQPMGGDLKKNETAKAKLTLKIIGKASFTAGA